MPPTPLPSLAWEGAAHPLSCREPGSSPVPTIWLQGWEMIPHWTNPSLFPLSANPTPWTGRGRGGGGLKHSLANPEKAWRRGRKEGGAENRNRDPAVAAQGPWPLPPTLLPQEWTPAPQGFLPWEFELGNKRGWVHTMLNARVVRGFISPQVRMRKTRINSRF